MTFFSPSHEKKPFKNRPILARKEVLRVSEAIKFSLVRGKVSSSCMYATTTHSAVVQVWENHRTLFVAHCSKAEDHFEEEAMLKRVFLLYYVSCNRVSPQKKSDQPLGKCPFYLVIVMGVLMKLIHEVLYVGHFDFS